MVLINRENYAIMPQDVLHDAPHRMLNAWYLIKAEKKGSSTPSQGLLSISFDLENITYRLD